MEVCWVLGNSCLPKHWHRVLGLCGVSVFLAVPYVVKYVLCILITQVMAAVCCASGSELICWGQSRANWDWSRVRYTIHNIFLSHHEKHARRRKMTAGWAAPWIFIAAMAFLFSNGKTRHFEGLISSSQSLLPKFWVVLERFWDNMSLIIFFPIQS